MALTSMQTALQNAMDAQNKALPTMPVMPLVFTVVYMNVNPVNGYKKLIKTPVIAQENFVTAVMLHAKHKDELENGFYSGVKGYVKIFLSDVTPDGILTDTGMEIMDYTYIQR